MVFCLRILALSDIHQRLESLNRVLERVDKKSIDLIIVAGDLTNYGDAGDASEVLSLLEFAKVFAVPGNLDTQEVLSVLEKRKISLHAKCAKFKGYKFCGFGFGLIGSAGSVLFPELEIEKALSKLVTKGSILVTHLPPKDTKLDAAANEHIGSIAIRNIILKKKPLLNICGHAHEAYGKIKLGDTACVNVAAVKDGRAFIIEVGKSISVKKVRI